MNRNAFKKIRGIMGFLSDGAEGVIVTIFGPDWNTPVVTDIDGFFGYSFHHKGKQFTYEVIATGYTTVYVDLKAGRFGEAILVKE